MPRRLVIIASMCLALASCAPRRPEGQITHVRGNDTQMIEAMEKARSSVPTFLEVLKSPRPGQSGFAVKKRYAEGPHTEHVWLSPITYDGTLFHGTISNDPEWLRGVKSGEPATVRPSEISDWMYIENGKLIGGETLKVLRNLMSPDEKAQFDPTMPFSLE